MFAILQYTYTGAAGGPFCNDKADIRYITVYPFGQL
jgi:hypothetical protein